MTNPDYLINKGHILSYQKKYSKALDCYEKALELDSRCYLALIGKGKILADCHRYADAIDCYNKAIDLNPNSFESYFEKGNALYQLNKSNTNLLHSVQCFSKAIKLNPKNSLLYIGINFFMDKIHFIIV